MDSETDALIAEFVAAGGRAADWAPDFSVAPTDAAPIVREHRHDDALEREIELASWGFRPSWAKGKGPSPINARLETVASNGLFRGAFAKQRAIVPMRGYYEWTEAEADGKTIKIPHFIHGAGELLAAAGIYTVRKVDDEWVVSMAIITREARDASGEVHDRMPVFLTPDTWGDWTSPAKLDKPDEKQELVAMLDRASLAVASTITTYPVSKRVNNVRDTSVAKDDPSLIAPLAG